MIRSRPVMTDPDERNADDQEQYGGDGQQRRQPSPGYAVVAASQHCIAIDVARRLRRVLHELTELTLQRVHGPTPSCSTSDNPGKERSRSRPRAA